MAKTPNIETKVTADTRQFDSAIKGAIKLMTQLAIAGSPIGAYKLVDRMTASVDQLGKTAQKVGSQFESFQSLSFAAKLADVPVEQLQAGMGKLARAIGEARNQGSEAASTFRRLGIDASELAKLPFDEQYIKISEALQKVGNSTERAILQQQLFGRGGVEQTNLLMSNIGDLKKEWDSYGITLTEAQRRQSETFQDAKTRLTSLFQGFSENVASEIAPAFTEVINAMIRAMTGTTDLKDASRDMAAFFIGGIQGLVKQFDILLTVLDSVIDRIDDMKAVGSVFKAGYDIARNAASGVIENVMNTIPDMNESIAGGENFFIKQYKRQRSQLRLGPDSPIGVPERTSWLGGRTNALQDNLAKQQMDLRDKSTYKIVDAATLAFSNAVKAATDPLEGFSQATKMAKADAANMMDEVKRGLEHGIKDIVDMIDNVKDGVNRGINEFERVRQNSSLLNTLNSNNKSKVDDQIQRILGKQLEAKPDDTRGMQAYVEMFDYKAQQLFENLKEGTAKGGTSAGSVQNTLAQLMRDAKLLGPSFEGVVDEIKKFAEATMPGTMEPPKQQVDVNIGLSAEAKKLLTVESVNNSVMTLDILSAAARAATN